MRKTPSKGSRRPITQHNVSPLRGSPGAGTGRPGTVLTNHVRFQAAVSPFSPEPASKPQEDSEQTEFNAHDREALSASPLLGKYRKKYEIENHSYLGIPGASVFAGVLQRDEVALLKEKKAQQQQEVKAALQLQILEKQRRIETQKACAREPPQSEVTETQKLQANPQSDEAPAEVEKPPPNINHLYSEILREHQSLKAKVESQEAWIQQLIYRSMSQARDRSPVLKKPGQKPRSRKTYALSANQRRAHSSAAGLPVDSAKLQAKQSDFSLFLEESAGGLKCGNSIPVTSTATPAHKAAEKTLEGDSMFLYPSAKGDFEEWQQELKHYSTQDHRGRRDTSVPRQRREMTPNLRFPKDVFPMSIKRRPALF